MAPASKIKVMIADDHELVRKGIMALIKSNSKKILLTGEAENGKDLLELVARNEPDIVLLDIEMPVFDGKDTLQVLQVKHQKVKVIMLSMFYNEAYLTEFMRRGALGYLPKNCSAEKLVDTITLVYADHAYFNEKISMAMYQRLRNTGPHKFDSDLDNLSERELEVLRLVCRGMSSKTVAEKLKISEHTVAFHRINISKKTRIKNLSELTRYAIRNKLI